MRPRLRYIARWLRWNTRHPLEPFEVENRPLVAETWLSVIEKIEKKSDEAPPPRT